MEDTSFARKVACSSGGAFDFVGDTGGAVGDLGDNFFGGGEVSGDIDGFVEVLLEVHLNIIGIQLLTPFVRFGNCCNFPFCMPPCHRSRAVRLGVVPVVRLALRTYKSPLARIAAFPLYTHICAVFAYLC